MDLDLGLVASFVVLADECHFGRAAARLHLTSSALTKRIQHLERQLGVKLVDRDSVGMVGVTPAGSRFAGDAVRLLAHAAAARRAAQAASVMRTVRFGFPAGDAAALRQRIGLALIAAEVRLNFPNVHLVCREVPFDSLNTCLSSGRVDVLWTSAAVERRSIASVPLQVTAERVGIVGVDHPLAEVGAVDVGVFSEEPMLFNPNAPREWMDAFWLADVRPRRAARLIEIEEADHRTVMRRLAAGRGVTTTLKILAPPLGARLRAVALLGAAPLVLHAARRQYDRRAEVGALMDALTAIDAGALA